MFRYFIHKFVNNEKFVEQLSQSYIIRRAAQITIAAFYQSKTFAHENNLQNLSPERFKEVMRSFQNHLRKELEAAQRELERHNKK